MSPRRLALRAFVAGFVLHTLALYSGLGWGAGSRGLVLVWMDFPLSLLWLQADSDRMFWLSLVFGGLWWGVLTALLSRAIGRLTAGR